MLVCVCAKALKVTLLNIYVIRAGNGTQCGSSSSRDDDGIKTETTLSVIGSTAHTPTHTLRHTSTYIRDERPL